MTFNEDTRLYTVADICGRFDWITDDLEVEDYRGVTDEGIEAWVDEIIETTIEQDDLAIEERAEAMSFPAFGYTNKHVYEDKEDYLAQKKEELRKDLAAEKPQTIQFIKDWISVADAPTSHQVKMTIHTDLYSVITDYANAHDTTIAFAAAQLCAIGAEATEGRYVRAAAAAWGGSRPGAGRPVSLVMIVEDDEGNSAYGTYGHEFTSVDEAIDYLKPNGGIIQIAEASVIEAEGNKNFAQKVTWEDKPREIIVEANDD